MKTTNTTAGETAQETKTNVLLYRTTANYKENNESYTIIAELRLDDVCHNGHEDFAFTCDSYEILSNGRRQYNYGGSDHEAIIKHFPGLIDDIEFLHNCDYKGAPMYAVENTFYFIKEHNRKAVKSNLYVCSEEEIDEAMKMSNKDELYFAAWLEEKHIPERWKEAANKAIAKLESLTGKKFESKATKSHYTPLSEEQKWTLKQRIENGYYTEEAAEQRTADEIDAAIAHNVDYYERKIKKAQQELDTRKEIYAVLKTMSRNDLKTFKRLEDNFIIYSDPDRICFNWASHRQAVSEEEIKEFEAIIMGNDILNSYIVTNKK